MSTSSPTRLSATKHANPKAIAQSAMLGDAAGVGAGALPPRVIGGAAVLMADKRAGEAGAGAAVLRSHVQADHGRGPGM